MQQKMTAAPAQNQAPMAPPAVESVREDIPPVPLEVPMVNQKLDANGVKTAIEQAWQRLEGDEASVAARRVATFDWIFAHAVSEDAVEQALKPDTWGIPKVAKRTPPQKSLASRLSEAKVIYKVRIQAAPSDYRKVISPDAGNWPARIKLARDILAEIRGENSEKRMLDRFAEHYLAIGTAKDEEEAKALAMKDLELKRKRDAELARIEAEQAAQPLTPEQEAEAFVVRVLDSKSERYGKNAEERYGWIARFADYMPSAFDKITSQRKAKAAEAVAAQQQQAAA